MRAVTIVAIAAILVGSYLGGKMSSTGVVEYEFAEVRAPRRFAPKT